MTNIQELIDTANKLSSSLELSANNERTFCIDIQMRLEQMSWEAFKMANDLRQIKECT